MNDFIDLPHLPDCLLNLPLETLHDIQSHTYHAIKADRQRRGEPVAVLRFDRQTPGRDNEMPRVVSCNRLPDGDYPVYTAPQPTAPALEPSDAHFVAEALRTANWAGCPIGNKVIIQSAIALLARYGNRHIEHPSAPEPMKYDGKRDDQYVTGWNDCLAGMLAAAPKFGEEE